MDISLCCFESGSKTLIWSGANNPLWILRKEEIIEFSPTKRPIGNSSISAPFEEHKMVLNEGDFLFLFSDGIIDQFGGEKGKKFKKSGLREAALKVHEPTSETLVNSIKNVVENWMSQTEQIDDIALLIVGIEF
jgi:serine phosphatase RsbU (regulator of sigma subunit)